MRWSQHFVIGIVGMALIVGVGMGCSDSDDDGGGELMDTGPLLDTGQADVPDGEPVCEPTAIPCCNARGMRVTYAQCTFDGLECPAGLTEMNCYDSGMQSDAADTGEPDDVGGGGDAQTTDGGETGDVETMGDAGAPDGEDGGG